MISMMLFNQIFAVSWLKSTHELTFLYKLLAILVLNSVESAVQEALCNVCFHCNSRVHGRL